MKRLIASVLLACGCVGLVLAHSLKTRSESSNVVDTFKQLTQDWENATQARDVDKVSQIEADDLRIVGSNGKVSTKEQDLEDLKSPMVQHVQAEFGSFDVKMLGDDVAVVQATMTDKSVAGNIDARPLYAFIDVWEKSGGRWMVVRSDYFRVK
jgi:ketosteroid isomerase-like protein